MARLYLIAGHGQGDPGAVGNGYKEADVVRTIANKVFDLCKNRVTTSLYPTTKDLYQSKDYSVVPAGSEVVEIHLNASDNVSATGTEVLIKTGFSADTVDQAILGALRTYFTDRGFKPRSDLANMNYFASKGISYRLIEVCFISNANDMKKLMSNMDAFCSKLADALVTSMGGSASSGGGTTTNLYRVRKTWADAASQLGAFSSLDSAKALCDKNSGYSVFDQDGKKVYPTGSKTVNYIVRINVASLAIKAGPASSYATNGTVTKDQAFTIIEENNGWGRLKSGAGWILLSSTVRV